MVVLAVQTSRQGNAESARVILARENDEAMAADTGYMHRCCNLTRLPKQKYLLEQSVPKKRRKDENEAAKTYPKLRPPTHFGDGGVFSCDDSTIRALFCTTFSQLRLEHSQATVLRTLRSPHLSHIIFLQELESNWCQSLDRVIFQISAEFTIFSSVVFGVCDGSFWTRFEMSSSSLQQQRRPPPTDPKQLLRLRSSTPRTGPARQAAWAQQVSKPWRAWAGPRRRRTATPRRGAPSSQRRPHRPPAPRPLEERWREPLRRRDSERQSTETVSKRAPPFFSKNCIHRWRQEMERTSTGFVVAAERARALGDTKTAHVHVHQVTSSETWKFI